MQSDNAVAEIKQRLDIVELISEHVQLRRSGSNFKGLCPFHGEKTASFMVSPDKQIFHCFGCSAGGDVIGFTMKYEGLSFPEALEVLAKKAGVELTRSSGRGSSERQGLKTVQADAMAYFGENLARVMKARKYVEDRGISAESVARFSLGYAPPGWHNLEQHLRRKGHNGDLIRKSGLVADGQKGPYDIFRDRIMFPIADLHGEPIAFGGRVMDGSEPKYLNSPDTELFRKGDNLYALNLAREGIRKEGFAVVVEGYMDAIMCHQHGISSAVAPLGTALTQGHLKKLRRYSERAVLIFDGDRAGINAARRSLDLIMAESMRASVLVLPEGEDPDSILKAGGEAALRELLKAALSPVEFVLRHTAEGDALRECVEMISKAADPLMRDQFVLELADLSRISEGAIREKLGSLRGGPYVAGSRRAAARPARNPVLKAYNEEMLLLSALIASPAHGPSIIEQVNLEHLTDPMVRGLLEKLSADAASAESVLSLADTDEERQLITQLSVSPGFELEQIDRNIEDCIMKLNSRQLDGRIKAAEQAGDMKLLQQLIMERQNLMKREQG